MAYTNINDPSAHFQATEYTGTGSTQSVVNTGNSNLKPDWVWIGGRASGDNNSIFDSSRGVTKELISNGSNAESTDAQLLTQFDTDGFTVGTNGGVNGSGDAYVGWQWKANGGTTSSNTDGTITSSVQTNTNAGFSIVTYTGNGTSGATIGHGLGAKPAWIVTKALAGYDWIVRHHRSATVPWYAWDMNNTGSQQTSGVHWTSTEPTTSVFSVGNAANTNRDGYAFVAYCFAEVKGFSMFGTYRGNNSTNGPFVYTGFKPAFLFIKRGGQNWHVWDSARDPHNVANKYVSTSTDLVEYTSGANIDLLSNGFKLKQGNDIANASGSKYQYMAFAENPFVTSTGTPTTAR